MPKPELQTPPQEYQGREHLQPGWVPLTTFLLSLRRWLLSRLVGMLLQYTEEGLNDMPMKLSQVQRQFTSDISDLITYVYDVLGYELTFGDAYRSPLAHGAQGEQGPYGEAWSAHKNRLAVDFNLFVNGQWIDDGDAPQWREIGEYWEELDTENVWGGHFNDANHFSRRWAGIA